MKDPTASSTLYTLSKFIAEHGIPSLLITDSGGILGVGKKWKQVIERTLIPLHLSELDKHNQNPVKRAIDNLKAGCIKISNACGTGVLTYHYEIMEYLCSVNNYVAPAILYKFLPYEALWGETSDISIICLEF